MTVPEPDTRTEARKRLDEEIANESQRVPPSVVGEAKPLEAYLGRPRRPVAIVGIVENGVVKPVDPTVKLPERSRVIIVAQDAV